MRLLVKQEKESIITTLCSYCNFSIVGYLIIDNMKILKNRLGTGSSYTSTGCFRQMLIIELDIYH